MRGGRRGGTDAPRGNPGAKKGDGNSLGKCGEEMRGRDGPRREREQGGRYVLCAGPDIFGFPRHAAAPLNTAPAGAPPGPRERVPSRRPVRRGPRWTGSGRLRPDARPARPTHRSRANGPRLLAPRGQHVVEAIPHGGAPPNAPQTVGSHGSGSHLHPKRGVARLRARAALRRERATEDQLALSRRRLPRGLGRRRSRMRK